MKINIKLNKTLKDSIGDSRTSVYVWKNLDHLKSFYSDVVDAKTVNSIANKIINGQIKINNAKYKNRQDLGDVLNESCLCNLVEMELLNNQAVLDEFLQKPVKIEKKV